MSVAPLVNTVTLTCKQQRVRAVRYNVDGAYCLTCGDDKKVRLWNPQRSLALKTYGGHADAVLDACGSCDSSHIVSCGGDRSVILWDVATAQPLRRYRSHAAAATCVRYNEESTMAVSGSVDNMVMLWDVGSRRLEPVQVLREAKDSVTSLQVTAHEILTSIVNIDIRCLVVGSVDNTVMLWDVGSRRLEPMQVLREAKDSVTSLQVTAHEILTIIVDIDIRCLVAGSVDNTVMLWDVGSRHLEPVLVLREAKDSGTSLQVIAHEILTSIVDIDIRCLVAGSVDNTVMLWDVGSRRLEPVQVLREAKDSVTSLQVTGHEILTSSADGHIRLYDIRVGRVTSDYVADALPFASLTRDGQCCVASCPDAVRLLDKDSGELLATYVGHVAADYAIENAVDCKDSHVVSGSATGEIWFWDLISGSCAFRLTHTAGRVVHSISHHPTQSALLSASDDTVKLWSVPDSIDEFIL